MIRCMKLLMLELGAIQCALVVGLAVLLAASPASACRARAALELGDIQYASVVVVGRIQNYEIVQATDERSKFWRAKSKSKKILSDYARFEVVVDRVLVGQPSQVIPVTWDNSTFAEPEAVKTVPYLIGLREAGSKTPPLRGPSATILPSFSYKVRSWDATKLEAVARNAMGECLERRLVIHIPDKSAALSWSPPIGCEGDTGRAVLVGDPL